MKSRHVFAIAMTFFVSLPAAAGQSRIDRERMKQDLDIMEGILQNLHAQTTTNLAGIHREPQVRGLYFENYGVIFVIEEGGLAGYPPPGLGFPEQLKKVFEMHGEGDVTSKFKKQVGKRRADIQNRLSEFLGTYADAIRQLKDTDRISILVFFQRLSPYKFNLNSPAVGKPDLTWAARPIRRNQLLPSHGVFEPDNRDSIKAQSEKGLDSDTFFFTIASDHAYSEVTARKGDIVAYRREKINDAEFRKRIAIRDHRPDASTMKKIGVMATILDKALKQTETGMGRFDPTIGIYQKGLGALFFVNAKSWYRRGYRVMIKKDPDPVTYHVRPGKSAKGESRPHDRIKNELVEVVGDYGYTLRTLKPEEYIVVEARLPKGMRRKTSDPRGLVLKVKKHDVDAYTRKDLDLAAFRETVDIQEY